MAKTENVTVAKSVRCKAITKAWASQSPGATHRFIGRGEIVEWPLERTLRDGKVVERKLPTWLVPLDKAPPEKKAAPEPRTLSEVQGSHPARRPIGA